MSTAQVLPKELRLSAPPTMPQARSYLFKQQSTQTKYDSSQQIVQINIPRLQRSYLTKDSYLSFRLTPNTAITASGGGVYFDLPGAFGVIDKIEIYDYLGSTLLESTSGHGQLMALLMDLDCAPSEVAGHFNVIAGTDSSLPTVTTTLTGTLPGGITGATSASTAAAIRGSQIKGANAANLDVTDSFDYAIPLFSFLGSLSNKFVPLHNGFTIMITLNPGNIYAGTADATAANGADFKFDVSNVYMNCQILELGPTAESMLLSSSNGQPLVVPAKAYRNYKSSVSAGQYDFRLDLNLNVASLTNILWIMRKTSSITTNPGRFKSLSYRLRNNLLSWYFQYGSSILPQTTGIQAKAKAATNVKNGGCDEAYIELLKSRHGLNSDIFTTQISKANYIIDAMTASNEDALSGLNTNIVGKFAAGLDLELVPGRSQNLICGMNTNGMNTSIYGSFDSAAVAATVDAWCEYDAFINISPGIATTVSF